MNGKAIENVYSVDDRREIVTARTCTQRVRKINSSFVYSIFQLIFFFSSRDFFSFLLELINIFVRSLQSSVGYIYSIRRLRRHTVNTFVVYLITSIH